MRLIAAIMLLLSLYLGAVCAKPTSSIAPSPTTTEAEAVLGKDVAKDVEKENKLVNDEKAIARLNTIANDIAPFTQRPGVKYTCKILDSDAINAMAIPGGIIYVTKGLLAAVETDHELAGVLAHEIAHNSCMHLKKLGDKEQKGTLWQLASVLASIYVGNTANHGNNDNTMSSMQMLAMSQMVKEAVINGYTIELELDADLNAIDYLYKTKKYSPVGLYSVMLGFRQMEAFQGPSNLGYIQNHPNPQERLRVIKQRLEKLKFPINVWCVVNFTATVEAPAKDAAGYTLKLGNAAIFKYLAASGEQDAQARAAEAAQAINARLTIQDDEIQRFDITAKKNKDDNGVSIRIRNVPVMTLIPADLPQDATSTLAELSAQIVLKMQQSIANEQMKRGM